MKNHPDSYKGMVQCRILQSKCGFREYKNEQRAISAGMSNLKSSEDAKALPVRQRIFRFLVPDRSRSGGRPDLVLQTAQVVEHEKRAVSAVVPAIPAIAIIYVAVNVLVQVGGNRNLALAIVTNLPLGSLAMVVFLNAAGMVLMGMAIAGPAVVLDQTQTSFVRQFFALATLASAIIYAFAFSALLAVFVLVMAYVAWRLRVPPEPLSLTFRDWVKSNTAPDDAGLYEIWKKARTIYEEQGSDEAVFSSLKVVSLKREARERRRAIQSAATPDFRNAIYRSGAVLMSSYGLMLLTSPVQLGPLEIVQFKTGTSVTGYVLIANEDRGVVYDAKAKTVRPIVASEITGRLICTKTPTWLSMTIGDLGKASQLSWVQRESCS
ncbi:hypothetical protein FJ661_09780 [Pseudarthrobacter phenanthrenivorans]|uniref:hypothetical protein n=1 Tax=Pseudarthrobacter phenanthrenivorans TaxID=361575 RepID=UPI00112B2938|nr:hypothetical protein [Pseudarthrobacter phenanthrenivorans]TPV51052.1 hypothetical protein FJ661_09780 [Pseudarthrobacter phenanthrenivorans]